MQSSFVQVDITRPVPLWICIVLMFSVIFGGASKVLMCSLVWLSCFVSSCSCSGINFDNLTIFDNFPIFDNFGKF